MGARACSSYGAHVARMFGRELAAAGLVVVSGMARGVDGEAHRGALEAGGRTVAVLGCGVDRDYPAAHAELARRISRDGLVVSEYAPGVEPAPWRFPARNRIVAGLAQVTVVIEAREKSGALITADLAVEEGREVFAVPGEITNVPLDRHERAVEARRSGRDLAADVLESFGLAPHEPQPPDLTPPAEAILKHLRDGPQSADELVRALALDAGAATAALAGARAARTAYGNFRDLSRGVAMIEGTCAACPRSCSRPSSSRCPRRPRNRRRASRTRRARSSPSPWTARASPTPSRATPARR